MTLDHADARLPEDTERWITSGLGADILGVERFPRGRQAWWLDLRMPDGDVRRWMLKGRRAPAGVIARSRLLSDFGPAREAAAMRAVTGAGIRVPLVGGFDSASGSLLVQRVAGSALLQRLPIDERRSVARDYARQLAALHALAWQELPIDSAIPRPASAEEMVVGGWLRSAEADSLTARGRLRHAEPLHDLLSRWLHERRPPGRDLADLRLLHGDAGVNNFLFDDTGVTALIDWELALLGDPMSDLGNARYRESLYPTGTFADLIDEYEASSGAPVDAYVLSYYTVLASAVLSLGMVANVHNPRASQPEVVARIWQDALARCVACEALAEAEGYPLEYDGEPLVSSSSFEVFAELLTERATGRVAVESDIAAEQGYWRLAQSVQAMVRSGAEVDSRLIEDVTPLLPARPGSVDAALDALSRIITGSTGFDEQAVLVVLARDARRRLEILRPLQSAEMWEDSSPVVTGGTGPSDGFVLPGYSLTKQRQGMSRS